MTLPRLRRHASAEVVVRAGTVLTMAVLVVLALAQSQALAVAAQTQLPNWVRGRGVAVYLTTFYGAMAAGSLVWGQLADFASVPVALLAAAALGGVALVLSIWKPLPEAEPDLTPSLHWPEPALSAQMAASLAADRGPVLVTVTYNVAEASVPTFLQALHRLAHERLRDGADHWAQGRP